MKEDRYQGSDAAQSAWKKSFENFWYYYKWHTIVGIFIAFCLIVIFGQMAGKTPYDAHVMYTGPLYFDRETAQSVVDSIAEVSEGSKNASAADYTGDGALSVNLNASVYISPALAEEYKEAGIHYDHLQNVSTQSDFANMLMIGEYVILLIDRSLYDETVGVGAFLTWEDAIGYTPEGAIDDYGIEISSLPISEMNGFRQLPEDTVLCCRAKSYINKFNDKVQNAEMYRSQLALFKQLVEYTETEE